MKKMFRAVLLAATVILTSLSVSSCLVKQSVDSLVSYHRSFSMSFDSDAKGVTMTDIDNIIEKVFAEEGDCFDNTLILYSQHSEAAVKKRATNIGKKVENAIYAAYPNVSKDLSSNYTSLSYSIDYSFDGKGSVVWTLKIR